MLKLTLVGVGAADSPRYRPAGLLVRGRDVAVMLDGGGTALPPERVGFWLVCDLRCELIADIRRRARALDVRPGIAEVRQPDLWIRPMPVVHTSHPTVGYLIESGGLAAAWAPEFWRFPGWAAGTALMFADAAGWHTPIRFAHGTGGHMPVLETASQARARGVRRLVFAHVGRPSIRAIDAGEILPFGEWGEEGHSYLLGEAR